MVSFFNSLLTTFVIMLLAEIADKTNLLALSLMSETKQPKSVALGGLLGISIVTIIGILFSAFIQSVIPTNLVVVLSGIIFIVLGVLGLISDDDDEIEDQEEDNSGKNTFWRSAMLIGIAEFGDKSQIFVISSSLVNNWFAVFLGAILGMGVIMFLTVVFGEGMLKKIPEKELHLIASILFIIVGIWILLF